MFRIVDGPPGSGKSYFMVAYLSKFFEYDAFFDEFVLKSDVLLLSNIDGLRVKHLNIDVILENTPVDEFFTVANFEKMQHQYRVKNIIVLMDEAQRVFDTKYDHKEVMYFFQYHRHLGVDLLLGTQHAPLVSRKLIPLCEYICSATPRSKSIVGAFSYEFKDNKGKFMYSKALRKKQTVFRAYKSMSVDEISKPKNAVLHWALIALVFFGVGGFLFKSALAGLKSKSERAAAASKALETPVKPVVPVAAAPAAAVQAPISSASGFVAAAGPVPVVVDRSPLPVWYRYDVDRYYKVERSEQFVIGGRTYLPPVCRDYDRSSQTAVCRSSIVGEPAAQVGAHAETPAAGSMSHAQPVNSAPDVSWGGAGDNPQYVPRYHASGYNPSDWVKYSDRQARDGR